MSLHYLSSIKEQKPLNYNITNELATNLAGNGLIALGASPAMSNTPEEAEEMAMTAQAVVLNLGTLTKDRAEAMLLAGKAANQKEVPVILDPIAVGATVFRTNVIYDILNTIDVSVIKANAGEIAVLGGALEKTESPDSAITKNDPAVAEFVARKYQTVVVSTSQTDVITDGERTTLCENGHAMLQNITASGCLLTSIVGAFASVSEDFYESSVQAVSGYGIAAERAMEQVKGPGFLIPALLDELYYLDDEAINTHQRLRSTKK